MGFVTSWFHFWGDRCLKTLAFMVPIENMCGLRQFLFLFPKNMVHIRFAGQITTFAGVSPASSSHFIHQFLGAAQAVAAGSTHSLLISEGKVYGMGDNCHGQLGLGSSVAPTR